MKINKLRKDQQDSFNIILSDHNFNNEEIHWHECNLYGLCY